MIVVPCSIVVYEVQVVGGAFVPHKPLDVYWFVACSLPVGEQLPVVHTD